MINEEDIIEQIIQLKGKLVIGFGIIEFDKELKEDLKDFKIDVQPLFNGMVNNECRYSFILTCQLKESWKARYDHFNKKYIITKKKVHKEENDVK